MALERRGKGGIWWYSFKFGGRRIHESSKSTSRTVARDAELQRRQLEERFNNLKKRELPPAFDKAADAWFESVKPHLAERTKAIYGDALRLHLIPALGLLLLCDLNADRIGAYQTQRKAAGASARTLNKELQVLRMILKRYKMWANLQGDVRFEREPDGIGKALLPEEESALLAACESNPLLRAVVTLALNTTMRDHEIKGLCWREVDLFERVLAVGESKTDAGTGRVIPLNTDATKALAGWAERFPEHKPEHYVFPACENARFEAATPDYSKVEPSRPIKSWRTAWRHARKTAGLTLRFHDLRHTAITKLAESQASDQTIMSIAGHVSQKMLEHYSHIRLAAKRAALDAISTHQPDSGSWKSPNFEGEVHQKVHQLTADENWDAPNLLN